MKKKISEEDLVDWWLEKYHNTNLKQVLKENPEWAENPRSHTKDFYASYQVTEAQYEEWALWAKKTLQKELRISKAVLSRSWAMTCLNVSPMVKTKSK